MKFYIDKGSFIRTTNLVNNYTKAIQNARPFFEQLSQQLLDENNKQFESEGKYLDTPWQSLKSETVSARLRLGYGSGPILQRTGKLKTSTYQKQITNRSLTMSNSAHYYKYHQLGGSKIPKRTILTWSRANKDNAKKLFINYLKRLNG